MNSTNQELLAQAARLTLGEGEIRGLLEKWAGLNLMRAVIPAVGTALGLFGAL